MWGSNRAADMEMFQFGERVLGTDPKGRPTKHGDHSLDVQCAWRIARAGEILVGSRDVYYPRGDPMQDVPGFQWDKAGMNRRDERLERFFGEREHDPPVVQRIEADYVGGLRLMLSDGSRLEIFPHDSLDAEGHSERWRLFRVGSEEPHFVVTGRGVELE
jgi:hypothetical protein